MHQTVIDLARDVKDLLELDGVHVHWDDATTTGSVYLDLDHGILGSIRVSDHKSKGNSFKFEIGSHIHDRHHVNKEILGTTYKVEKFPEDALPDLIEVILIARMKAKAQVGNRAYELQFEESTHDCPGTNIHPKKRRRKSRTRTSN